MKLCSRLHHRATCPAHICYVWQVFRYLCPLCIKITDIVFMVAPGNIRMLYCLGWKIPGLFNGWSLSRHELFFWLNCGAVKIHLICWVRMSRGELIVVLMFAEGALFFHAELQDYIPLQRLRVWVCLVKTLFVWPWDRLIVQNPKFLLTWLIVILLSLQQRFEIIFFCWYLSGEQMKCHISYLLVAIVQSKWCTSSFLP